MYMYHIAYQRSYRYEYEYNKTVKTGRLLPVQVLACTREEHSVDLASRSGDVSDDDIAPAPRPAALAAGSVGLRLGCWSSAMQLVERDVCRQRCSSARRE